MAQRLLRSLGVSLSRPVQQFHGIRSLSAGSSSGRVWGGRQNRNLPESAPESDEEFTRRIRDGSSDDNPSLDRFFSDLSWLNKQSDSGRGNSSEKMGGLDGSSSTLSDGMDGELKKAAAYFDFDIDEVEQDDYSFRPDVNFVEDGTYDIKDLDLTKPGVSKPVRREEFEVTTEEVLRKADFRASISDLITFFCLFALWLLILALQLRISCLGKIYVCVHGGVWFDCVGQVFGISLLLMHIIQYSLIPRNEQNVRFLANFITEAGIIIKRSQTGISAKAQRKVAREIKTARAFGLMPLTTMGTKSFIFGKTMESLEKDYEYDAIGGRGDENDPLEV